MEDYTELEELGKGSYGTVFKCRHKQTGQIVAVKQMKDEDGNEQMRKTALREAKILKQLQHPNVVRLLELFRSRTKLYMVFEFMDRTILSLLEKNPRGLPGLEVKKILWQLVLGLNFLHGQQIIHRDLKPENILTDDSGTVKLADFGFARPQTQGGQNLSPYVATRWYRAPELLVGDTYGPGVDVWAVGCLLVELATGKPLFPGKSTSDQLWQILRCVGCTPRQQSRMRSHAAFSQFKMPTEEELMPLERRYSHFDSATMSLLKACLEPEPKNRPTVVQLLTHEYFMMAKTILNPYTAAAVKAQTAAKATAGAAAATADPVLDRPTPVMPSPAKAAGPRPQAAPTTGWQAGQGTPGASKGLSQQHAVTQQHATMRQAGASGTAAKAAVAGGSQHSGDVDIGHGVTGSDGGQGQDEPDNEYEPEVGADELLSPEKRSKIQAWVDAIPEIKAPSRAVNVNLSITPGNIQPSATSSLQGLAASMAAKRNALMDAMSPNQSPVSVPTFSPTQHSHQGQGDSFPASPNLHALNIGATAQRQTLPATTTAAASTLTNLLAGTSTDSTAGLPPPPTDPGGTARNSGTQAVVGSGAASPSTGQRPSSALNALIQMVGPLTTEPPSFAALQQSYGLGSHDASPTSPFIAGTPMSMLGSPSILSRLQNTPGRPAVQDPPARQASQEGNRLLAVLNNRLNGSLDGTSNADHPSPPNSHLAVSSASAAFSPGAAGRPGGSVATTPSKSGIQGLQLIPEGEFSPIKPALENSTSRERFLGRQGVSARSGGGGLFSSVDVERPASARRTISTGGTPVCQSPIRPQPPSEPTRRVSAQGSATAQQPSSALSPLQQLIQQHQQLSAAPAAAQGAADAAAKAMLSKGAGSLNTHSKEPPATATNSSYLSMLEQLASGDVKDRVGTGRNSPLQLLQAMAAKPKVSDHGADNSGSTQLKS